MVRVLCELFSLVPRFVTPTKTHCLPSVSLPSLQKRKIEPFGVKAGQQVSIAVINLNSNIPTFVVSESVIQAATPGLVSLAESIASSQDLSDQIAAFVGIANTSAPKPTPDSPPTTATGQTADSTTSPPSSSPSNSANVVGSHMPSMLSWGGLLLVLPLFV